jgi:hypothetical protein
MEATEPPASQGSRPATMSNRLTRAQRRDRAQLGRALERDRPPQYRPGTVGVAIVGSKKFSAAVCKQFARGRLVEVRLLEVDKNDPASRATIPVQAFGLKRKRSPITVPPRTRTKYSHGGQFKARSIRVIDTRHFGTQGNPHSLAKAGVSEEAYPSATKKRGHRR